MLAAICSRSAKDLAGYERREDFGGLNRATLVRRGGLVPRRGFSENDLLDTPKGVQRAPGKVDAKRFPDFPGLDGVPREVGTDKLPVLALHDVEAMVKDDGFGIGTDEPHSVPHAAPLKTRQVAMVLPQARDGLNDTKPMLEAFGIGNHERSSWPNGPEG